MVHWTIKMLHCVITDSIMTSQHSTVPTWSCLVVSHSIMTLWCSTLTSQCFIVPSHYFIFIWKCSIGPLQWCIVTSQNDYLILMLHFFITIINFAITIVRFGFTSLLSYHNAALWHHVVQFYFNIAALCHRSSPVKPQGSILPLWCCFSAKIKFQIPCQCSTVTFC